MLFHQLDVKTAFLYGDLDKTLYMKVPEGMTSTPNSVLKLRKSLYGLKQCPRCWNNKFNSALIKLGFIRSSHDYCLYTRTKNGHLIYLVLYVDDIILAGISESEIEEVKLKLSKQFQMSDCGPLRHYLGTVVEYNKIDGVIKLSQEASIKRF